MKIRRHILDLCGDWFAYPPMDPMEDGKVLTAAMISRLAMA